MGAEAITVYIDQDYRYCFVMKKQRGLKRYYNNLNVQVNLPAINFNDVDSWSYNQHFHFDRRGRGNYSFKSRKPHLDKLFRHFELLAERTKDTSDPFQLYVVLLDYNSASDALFLHKPNESFPFVIAEMETKTTLTNAYLNSYIDELTGFEKRYGIADQSFCFLYRRGIGDAF